MEHLEQIREICQQLPPHPQQQQQQQQQSITEDAQQQLHTTTKSDDSASSSPSSTTDTQQHKQKNDSDIKTTTTTTSQQQHQDKDQTCSYTSMIAQSIMRSHYKRATLSEIYNYMTDTFEVLKKRGNGWRNCVRHTLSLNECFVKLNRPENGRSCNWTVHPSYFDAFMRGDYRKRRSNRKKSHRASSHQLQHWSSAMSGSLDPHHHHHHHHQQRYTSPYNNNSSHPVHQQPTPITMNGFPPHPPPPSSPYHHHHYPGLPPTHHSHHQVSPPLNHHHPSHHTTSQQQQHQQSTSSSSSSASMWQSYMSSLENHHKGFSTPPPPSSAHHHDDFNNPNGTPYDYQQSPSASHKHFVTPPTPPQVTSVGTHFPPSLPPSAANSAFINHHSSASPSSTEGNHMSPNTSFESPVVNTERLRHLNNTTGRNTSVGGFTSSVSSSPYLPIKLERNAQYDNYSCGSSERVVYERALSCEGGVPPIHHFQAENNLATCYGNLSNRSYRAEYF